MDVLYDEIDDITLSQVCQAMENEHTCVGEFEFHDINTDCAKLANFFLETPEVNSEPITEAANFR